MNNTTLGTNTRLSQPTVLVLEDDLEIADLVARHLEGVGLVVHRETHPHDALKKIADTAYSLVILDLNLPGMDGLEVCKLIRAQDPLLPVLMLTARAEEIDRVVGLEVGADDYVVKPFSVRELVARVKALLRRAKVSSEVPVGGAISTFNVGALTIDTNKRKVLLRGEEISFTATEFDLLAFLALNAGVPFTREQLLERVWEYTNVAGYEQSVTTLILRIRRKIESDLEHPQYIKTVHGVGYRFAESVELKD